MAIDPDKPHAFLSYTRADDEHFFKGGISWLREELEQLVSGYIGQPFQIFQDTEDIQPSDRWEHKLDQALRAAQLFIPILTPRFFQSDFCRREAKAFLDYEERAGRAGLILPLYFIRTPKFDNPAIRDADELAKALYARQYADWRTMAVRLQRQDTRPQLTETINQLAETIAATVEQDVLVRMSLGNRNASTRRQMTLRQYEKSPNITTLNPNLRRSLKQPRPDLLR